MKLNGVDWQRTDTPNLLKHPNKKQYLSRIPYKYNGQRKFKTMRHKETDLRVVKKLHNKFTVEVENTTPLQELKKVKKSQSTNAKLVTADKTVAQNLTLLLDKNASKASKKQHKTITKHLEANKSLYNKALQDVTFADLKLLRDYLRRKGFKQPTYTAIRGILSKMFKRAQLFDPFQHFTKADSFKALKASNPPFLDYIREKQPHFTMTATEVAQKLLSEIQALKDEDTKRVLLTALLLAKRISEIKSLKKSDFDLHGNYVTITIAKNEDTPKKKHHPIPKELLPLLKNLKQSAYIAKRQNVRNTPYTEVAQELLAKVTGVTKKSLTYYGIHAFRSIALQAAIDNGADEVKAERVMLDHKLQGTSRSYRTSSLQERIAIYEPYWKLLGVSIANTGV